MEGTTTNLRADDEVLDEDSYWYGYSSDSDLEDDSQESKDVDDTEGSTIAEASSAYGQLGDPLQISEIYYQPMSSNER